MEVKKLKMEDKYKPLTESTYYVMIAFLYEKHGYAIKMFLEDKTHGRISLGPGTLYGIINKLNEKNYLTPIEDDENDKRNSYELTAEGKEVLKNEYERIKEIYTFGERFIDKKL